MTYYNVGKIVNTQGLQGELRVLSVTDFADERFKKKSVLALCIYNLSNVIVCHCISLLSVFLFK